MAERSTLHLCSYYTFYTSFDFPDKNKHIPQTALSLTMQKRTFLTKCHYECDNNARRASQRFRSIKVIRRGQMTRQNLRKAIAKFDIRSVSVALGRERKIYLCVYREGSCKNNGASSNRKHLKYVQITCCLTQNSRSIKYDMQNYPLSAVVLVIQNQTCS